MKSYGIDYLSPVVPELEEITVVDSTLSWLITSLRKKHNKRAIVLVDEYDSPLNHAFRQGFYKEASNFFGSFYSQALKGNSALEKACLMGMEDVRLPGLNNICVYSLADSRYSSYFGFTEGEM